MWVTTAIGIQDITLYHAVRAQKTFTEKILRYIQSGVISIGRDEKIRLCNHRAAEILGKSWSDVLQADPHSLPSPLGDMLCATLYAGMTYQKHEVLLTAGKVSLAVNTYQIFDEHGEVSGSVMVSDDLTVQKQLAEERRRADQLDFLNRVVGRMAYEIKNPLVSIQTFVELLNDHYDDREFRDYFRTTVSRDVRTVDGITEKLVGFASKISYRFAYDDVNKVLQHLVASLTAAYTAGASSLPTHNGAETAYAPASWGIEIRSTDQLPPVRFDAEQLHKALMYIAVFLQQGSNTGGKILMSSQRGQYGHSSGAAEWVSLILRGRGRRLSTEELQQWFDPFCMEHSTLVDVGPCVSQKIIEEHGGHLDVHQEKNGDTTFVIALSITP